MSRALTILTLPQASAITEWLPPLLMIAGVTMLGVLAALMIAGKRRQQRDEAGRLDELTAAVQQSMQELEAEMTRLKKLLAVADERSAMLERIIAHANAAATTPSRQSQSPAAVEPKPSLGDASPPDAAELDQLVARVYRLADEGQPAAAIARQVNEHIGKVELMLALRAMNSARKAND